MRAIGYSPITETRPCGTMQLMRATSASAVTKGKVFAPSPIRAKTLALAITVAATLSFKPDSALAALGEGPTSPATDTPAARANSQHTTASRPGLAGSSAYTKNTFIQRTGTRIREFVNADGLVFAIAWNGSVPPDFQELFGEHFSALKAEAERNRALRKRGAPITLQSERLVVNSRGKLRQFSGYAYLPNLVPAGTDIHEVLR